MPKLDRPMVEELSRRTGFQMDVLEKVYRLTELLKEIGNVTEFRDALLLKGGTAVNFLYLDVPRLSVDIDLDYIGSVERQRMEEDRRRIETVLERLFRTMGYQAEAKRAHALQHYDLRYENSAGNPDRIEVEINFLERASFLTPVRKEVKRFFEFAEFEVLTLQAEELLARKLKALVKRGTARDLYDVHKLLTGGIRLQKKALRRCFIFALCLDGDPRGVGLGAIDEITLKDVKAGLLPLLRKGEHVELDELKSAVRAVAEGFLRFTKAETEFIRRLYDHKDYRADLLFKGLKYNPAIAQHPGIAWRLQHL